MVSRLCLIRIATQPDGGAKGIFGGFRIACSSPRKRPCQFYTLTCTIQGLYWALKHPPKAASQSFLEVAPLASPSKTKTRGPYAHRTYHRNRQGDRSGCGPSGGGDYASLLYADVYAEPRSSGVLQSSASALGRSTKGVGGGNLCVCGEYRQLGGSRSGCRIDRTKALLTRHSTGTLSDRRQAFAGRHQGCVGRCRQPTR